MKFTRNQAHGTTLTVSNTNITAEQIREAQDRWPERISSETAATALALPIAHTEGGLPIYPSLSDISYARDRIAAIINHHWLDASSEHTTET